MPKFPSCLRPRNLYKCAAMLPLLPSCLFGTYASSLEPHRCPGKQGCLQLPVSLTCLLCLRQRLESELRPKATNRSWAKQHAQEVAYDSVQLKEAGWDACLGHLEERKPWLWTLSLQNPQPSRYQLPGDANSEKNGEARGAQRNRAWS